jgi:hypothetical protein
MKVLDAGWVERMLGLAARRPSTAKAVLVPGDLLVSRKSGRRAEVRWVAGGRACLVFDGESATKVHALSEVSRLYRRV